ncbi:MAG: DNA translocase FtsK [Paludibacteraceae bacterium]|nr:DNA translocase FtsK [Paludibacteraceae bacterium]
MPRTVSKSRNIAEERPNERAIRVERANFWDSTKRFFQARETRMVIGILLLLFAVIALLSYVSFLFTGTYDQDILSLSRAERVANRAAVRNIIGLPGAVLAQFMIDGSFGFVSLLIVLLLGVYALRMMHVLKDIPALKLFFCTSFWVLWGSVVLGFIHDTVHQLGVFRWGGAFGEAASRWLVSYVNTTGAILILVSLLVIFLIVTDPRFIDRCKAFGAWFAGLFKRKRKPTSDPSLQGREDGDEVVLDIPVDDNNQSPITRNEVNRALAAENNQSEDEVTFTIDSGASPQNDEESGLGQEGQVDITIDVPLVDDNDEPLGDAPLPPDDSQSPITNDLVIEDVVEDELYAKDPDKLLEKLGPYDPRKDLEFYKFPSLNLLKVYDNEAAPVINEEEQRANGARIVTTLRNYDIEIESIKATVGPTVTLYEIVPKAGIRVAKIQSLENDIMMSLSATGIRIIAPIPGKGTIGIEVPNENPQVVSMHSVIASKRFQEESKMRLPIAYGRTITNEVFMFDLAKTPHLLVAGATGTGKSVAINAIITSLLYKKHPAELKLVMVDPKMVEFAPYKPLLKHFLAAQPDTDPEQIVITDCDRVINTLNSLVIEMENRYKLLMDAGVRNLEDYNDKFVRRRLNPNKLVADSLHHQYLPYIVIIIDEYGDFIMQAGKQVETPIARITQKARAVGMHMILATQRPSVNIVTGVIKANIPTRIALRTQSVIDSRTVLDAKGAEQLIGRGDSLYAGNASITRVQCAFVDTPEVDEIVKHIAKQQRYTEPYQLPEYVGEGGEGDALTPGSVDMKRLDPMFADVARYVVTKQEGSTSRLQRAFEIGYNRAGKLSDQLEAAGIVGPNKGPKGRDVLIQDLDQLDKLLEELGVK